MRCGAASQRDISLQDRCEPTTFNAAVGAGMCVGNRDVTFAEFAEDLNPAPLRRQSAIHDF